MHFSFWLLGYSFEKFKEGLTSKDKFYNTLNYCKINDKNYEHVLNVWIAFKLNTMKNCT